MDAVFDPEFHPPAKSKPRKTWTPSARALGRLASWIVLGGLAILPAQHAAGRRRNPSKLQRPVLLRPSGNQILPQIWINPRTAPAADPFARPAPQGIDERFLVSAPTVIDENMVIPMHGTSSPGGASVAPLAK